MDVSFDAGNKVEFSDTYAYKWPSFSEAIKFNIGSTIIKKGKPKNKRDPKRVKTRVKSKKNIIPLYKKPLPPLSFKIYEGPRLFVPSTISLTHSEKLKFDTVNLYNPIKRGFSNAFFDIKTKYTFHFHNNKSMAFLKLPDISNFMQQSYKKDEYEWNKIRRLFLRIFKIKRMMQKICRLWLYR
ncbi:MAG: hypothetical protein EBS98_10855, partial [Chitinophagia bacterium]|nr:hypothetical protein [Chitinophagia bacterium]